MEVYNSFCSGNFSSLANLLHALVAISFETVPVRCCGCVFEREMIIYTHVPKDFVEISML